MDGSSDSLRTTDTLGTTADGVSALQNLESAHIAGVNTVESLIGLGNLSDNDK